MVVAKVAAIPASNTASAPANPTAGTRERALTSHSCPATVMRCTRSSTGIAASRRSHAGSSGSALP